MWGRCLSICHIYEARDFFKFLSVWRRIKRNDPYHFSPIYSWVAPNMGTYPRTLKVKRWLPLLWSQGKWLSNMKAWVAPPSDQGGQPGDGARRSWKVWSQTAIYLSVYSVPGKRKETNFVWVARPAVVEDHSFVIVHVSANSGRVWRYLWQGRAIITVGYSLPANTREKEDWEINQKQDIW